MKRFSDSLFGDAYCVGFEWHSLSLVLKKGNREGHAVPDRHPLRGMGSKGGEVGQSWASTSGETHLPLVKIKWQKVLSRFKGNVRQKRSPFTQRSSDRAAKLSSAKGQTSSVRFLTSSGDCIGCLQEFGELLIYCSLKNRKAFCQHVQHCLPRVLV